MVLGAERILTTHTGSLPRPERLITMIYAREEGQAVESAEFDQVVSDAVRDIVTKQTSLGIDILNDGEQGKVSYATYVKDRLTGFEGEAHAPAAPRLDDFPEYAIRYGQSRSNLVIRRKSCNGPITYRALDVLHRELDDFKTASSGVAASGRFLSAASPGVVSIFLQNSYYPSHEAYIFAIAEAMKTEYDAIHRAGFLLQLDCPDLAMSRGNQYLDLSLDEFRKVIRTHVEALNQATRDIPPEAMRMHLCWGNYEGPHHRDVPLGDIIDIVFSARPAGISFEAANPRHEHEWKLWEDVRLPDGRYLIPGVLDSTTNFVEHPELVAERIERFCKLVGRENVVAGTDCGFSTGAGYHNVEPPITWLKFAAMAEGARIASSHLW